MSSIKIKEIIDNNLCHRCGACISICPHDTLDLDDNLYPREVNECTDCGLCVKVCSGIEVNFPQFYSNLFDEGTVKDSLIGPFKKASIGHAKNKKIRSSGASGGIVSQILIYLFEKGLIDGALVANTDDKSPWKGKAVLARSKEDILKAAQSKMTVVPINSLLKDISNEKGKFAFIGLPCQVHAFRKLAEINPLWNKKIVLVIGLFCHLNLEPEATLVLIKANKINPDDVEKVKYRVGNWPGRMVAYLRDGSTKTLDRTNYLDTYNILSRLYYMNRCLYCIDGANELADISIADPWIFDNKGEWKYKSAEGWSTIIHRTKAGEKLIADAENDGCIFIEELSIEAIKKGQRSMLTEKKSSITSRLRGDEKKGKPVPLYHISFPEQEWKEKIKDSAYELFLNITRPRLIKDIIFYFAYSMIGDFLIAVQKRRKRRKKIKENQ